MIGKGGAGDEPGGEEFSGVGVSRVKYLAARLRAVTGDFLDPGGFNGLEVSGALFSLIGVHPVIAEPRQRGLVLTDPQVFKADAVAGEEGSGVDVFGGETRYRDFSRGRCHDVGQWRGEQQRAHGELRQVGHHFFDVGEPGQCPG